MASRRTVLSATAASAMALFGCAPRSVEGEGDVTSISSPSTTSFIPPAPPPDPVLERVPKDLRAKVATLMHPGVVNYPDAVAKVQAGVGGIFVTSWADPALVGQLWTLRTETGRSFDVSIDFEGGRVQRHAQVLGSFPAPGAMGPGAGRFGQEIGKRLRAAGVSVDFAPVLDVDGFGLSVVGDRAFSKDPVAAGELGAQFAGGLLEEGVKPVYKHFPGHGRASGDTHKGPAVTPWLGDIAGFDLRAFGTAFGIEPAAVMVGHMVVPGLGADGTPSSLNNHAYGLLRKGNYPTGVPCEEVAYTDDLTGMKAVPYGLAEAVVRAVQAGCDQALWSTGAEVDAVIDAVVAAVETGRIPQVRIDNAAYRVQRQLMENGL